MLRIAIYQHSRIKNFLYSTCSLLLEPDGLWKSKIQIAFSQKSWKTITNLHKKTKPLFLEKFNRYLFTDK